MACDIVDPFTSAPSSFATNYLGLRWDPFPVQKWSIYSADMCQPEKPAL